MLARAQLIRALTAALAASLASSAFAAAINVANWNMGNLPNNATDLANAGMILSYMGNSRPLDLLAMIETDTASANDVTSLARSVFGTPTYMSLVSGADGGSDRTGFVYNSSTLSLLSSTELSGGNLTHRFIRAHFQPVGGQAGSDFYVYSVHLKSGDGSSERATRVLEAQQLRADADTLGAANVLFVGDFNWTGSDERGADPIVSAFDVMTSSGAGQVFDPVNAVGSWRDNPAYLSLHTNDPGAAMDDRFDMQLASGELFDGRGLDNVSGSYRVIGNNGTHVLNGDIRTGTGAPVDVLNALYAFSDHLPVIASYAFEVPEPGCIMILVAVVFAGRGRGRGVG